MSKYYSATLKFDPNTISGVVAEERYVYLGMD